MVIAIRQKICYYTPETNASFMGDNNYEFVGKFKDFDDAKEKLYLNDGNVEYDKNGTIGIFLKDKAHNINNQWCIDYYYTLIELDKVTENAVIGLTYE